jgi:hypothetical protein
MCNFHQSLQENVIYLKEQKSSQEKEYTERWLDMEMSLRIIPQTDVPFHLWMEWNISKSESKWRWSHENQISFRSWIWTSLSKSWMTISFELKQIASVTCVRPFESTIQRAGRCDEIPGFFAAPRSEYQTIKLAALFRKILTDLRDQTFPRSNIESIERCTSILNLGIMTGFQTTTNFWKSERRMTKTEWNKLLK